MKSHRPERVANLIRQVVSEAMASKLNDPRIAPLTSVTRVEVSADLEYAKVSVSVMGPPAVGRRTIAGLNSARGYLQRMVAKQLSIRQCPHVTFHLDESIRRAMETLRLIDQVMAETPPGAGADSEAQADSSCGDGS